MPEEPRLTERLLNQRHSRGSPSFTLPVCGRAHTPAGRSRRPPTQAPFAQKAYNFAMTARPETTQRKEARLAMRLTPGQDALIHDGFAVAGQSLSEFVTTAAVVRIQDTLADRRAFRFDHDAWAQFTALLDRPPSAFRSWQSCSSRLHPGTSEAATTTSDRAHRRHGALQLRRGVPRPPPHESATRQRPRRPQSRLRLYRRRHRPDRGLHHTLSYRGRPR